MLVSEWWAKNLPAGSASWQLGQFRERNGDTDEFAFTNYDFNLRGVGEILLFKNNTTGITEYVTLPISFRVLFTIN